MVATIVLLIFLIVMMPAFGIYYLCQGIKSLYEGQFVFKGVVDKNRSKLLYEALGVSDRDLQVFHFDGKCFHLKEGIRHFSEFTSIRCLKTKNVKVRNKALPHNTTWMHTRVSGGPDRRYKHNPAIRQSTKYVFSLEGKTPSRFVSYSTAWNVAQIVDKFNTFLGMASRVDFEAIFCEYEAVAVRLNVLDQQYLNAVKQKSEVDSALAASLRLLSQGGNMPSNLEVTHRRLQAEQQEMQSRVLLLREKITAARSELSRLVQKAKDLQAIHRYHSQGAV